VGDKARGQLTGSRSGLDAGTTLSGQPEKSGDVRVEAYDHRPIGDEGSQPCPGGSHDANIQSGVAVDPIDCERNVDLVGSSVAWVRRFLLGERAQELAPVRTEVELIVGVADQRPTRPCFIPGDRERGASQRLQPDRSRACHGPDHIAPGAGGVDDDIGP
jgi:hypothetical protein